MATEPVVEIGDCLAGRDLRRGAVGDAVCGPLAQHQFHDRLAPAGERHRSREVIRITAAADQGRIAYAARRLVQRAAG